MCEVCGYVYDPAVGDTEHGIKAGTSFNDLPEIGLVLLVVLTSMHLENSNIN